MHYKIKGDVFCECRGIENRLIKYGKQSFRELREKSLYL